MYPVVEFPIYQISSLSTYKYIVVLLVSDINQTNGELSPELRKTSQRLN